MYMLLMVVHAAQCWVPTACDMVVLRDSSPNPGFKFENLPCLLNLKVLLVLNSAELHCPLVTLRSSLLLIVSIKVRQPCRRRWVLSLPRADVSASLMHAVNTGDSAGHLHHDAVSVPLRHDD